MNSNTPYNGGLTREQFLFYETRTVARLMTEGLSDDEIIEKVITENLFQNPTEKMLKNLATVCCNRLHAMEDDDLVAAIANQSYDVAKQICLYAMMKQYRLMWEFMITVVGEKYRMLDMSFGNIDMNSFFMRLQEQDETVASWKESTIKKLKQVLKKVLVENEYLDSPRADHLNPVMISSILESAIRAKGEEIMLPAFNCLY